MRIQENVLLEDHCTMGIGGSARYFTEVTTKNELIEALKFAKEQSLSTKVIGGGSNIIFSDKGFNGLVIKNALRGLKIIDTKIVAAAGELWDSIVEKSVELELSGIEALSKIPGTIGAAPVQNIGAYGQELASVFVELEAVDTGTSRTFTLDKAACDFSYRNSRLKYPGNKLLVTQVTLSLSRNIPETPSYRDVVAYFQAHSVAQANAEVIRQAITQIRAKKLPDPSVVPNCGSFFQNPIISQARFDDIAKQLPQINAAPPGWPQPPRWFLPDGMVKLAAGWLLEQAGFQRGMNVCGLKLWRNQALVLTNPECKDWKELQCAMNSIIDAVKKQFGIVLIPEPEIIT